MLFLINRMLLSQIYSLFKPHAFTSSATSDAAQTPAVGWVPQFRGRRRRFPGEPQSSTATVACGMCISPPPSLHDGSWERGGGDAAVAALRPRAWGSCAPGGDVQGGQGV